MQVRHFVCALVMFVMLFASGVARADDPEPGSDDGSGSALAPGGSGSAAEHHDRTGPAGAGHDGSAAGSAEEHHDGSAAGSAEAHHDRTGPAGAGHDGSAVGSAEDHHDGKPDPEDHPAAVEHHDATDGTAADPDKDGDGVIDTKEADYDPEDPPTDPWDEDGDGTVEPDEVALRAESEAAFKDIPDAPDEAMAKERNSEANELLELKPSLDVETFRKLVRIAKKIVLAKMEKIAIKSAQKMQKFSLIVVGFSGLGVLLLLMPIFLAKKYPGQGKLLLKYSALAALVFIVTVNLFGGVIYGFRSVQTAMSSYTNPATAIAGGTFDTLDDNADNFIVMGKELFAPTLDQMKLHPDEQPGVLLLENGMKLAKDAKVFLSIAKLFKKINFIFGILPIVLIGLTLILFVLAIRPTLTEIVKLPAQAAAGNQAAGKDVMSKSFARVVGELKATIGTIGVLVVLTLLSGTILGVIVKPAIAALLEYFALSISYLQYVAGASSGLVFMALFAVIMFLVLNLATLILSMAFFLGKSQKIFQARFNDGVPLATHARFFKWGIPSVLLVQVFPLVFVLLAGKVLAWMNDNSTEGTLDADAVSWSKIMLMGPIFLVVGFVVLFWAARGLKAIKFLATYKIPKPTPPAA